MSLSRKILLCVALFTLFVVLPLALFMLPIWDGPPPDDGDMRVPLRQITEEQNAFSLYMQAHAAMRFPDFVERREWLENPAAFRDDIQKLMDGNQQALEILREGIARGDMQGPWKAPDFEVQGVTGVLEITNTLRLLAKTAPNPVDRVEVLEILTGFSRSFRHTEGPLISELVRMAMEAIVFQAIRDAARDPDIPAETVAALMKSIENERPDSHRRVQVYQLEYQFFVFHLERVETSELFMMMWSDDLPVDFLFSAGFLYQPNNTRRLFHELYQEQINLIKSGAPPGNALRLEELEQDLATTPPWTPRGAFNRLGRLLAGDSVFFTNMDQNFTRIQANHAATVLLCALNLWQREHGELPEQIEELVPKFLTAIPLDPFDGAPMRYNRDLARVYALGENLTDNGGSSRATGSRPTRENAEDFVFGIFEEIDFRAGTP